jgi:hypothetical protein
MVSPRAIRSSQQQQQVATAAARERKCSRPQPCAAGAGFGHGAEKGGLLSREKALAWGFLTGHAQRRAGARSGGAAR